MDKNDKKYYYNIHKNIISSLKLSKEWVEITDDNYDEICHIFLRRLREIKLYQKRSYKNKVDPIYEFQYTELFPSMPKIYRELTKDEREIYITSFGNDPLAKLIEIEEM